MRKDERKQKFLPQGVQGSFLHIFEELSNRGEIRVTLWGLEGMEGQGVWVEPHWNQQREFYSNSSCLCLDDTLTYYKKGSPRNSWPNRGWGWVKTLALHVLWLSSFLSCFFLPLVDKRWLLLVQTWFFLWSVIFSIVLLFVRNPNPFIFYWHLLCLLFFTFQNNEFINSFSTTKKSK